MSATSSGPAGNALLASLPPDVLERMRPKLSHIPMVSRQPIYDEDGPIEFVYFPENGMVSMVTNLTDGMQAEVGVIGREGMVGVSIISGVTTSFVESMVQMSGSALRMAARDFRQEFDETPALRSVILRYAEAFQCQIMQTAACNGRHELEKRLARWLLMCHDRQLGDSLHLTQEFMAMMLGVHRPSITVSAGVLHRAGLISYGAGRINILDRPGLEALSCECYAAVRRRFERLLPTTRLRADDGAMLTPVKS